MVDLCLGQDPQGLDRGQGGEALALLNGGIVVGAGGQGERQPAGGAVDDVLAQALLQAGQGREAVNSGTLAVDGGQCLGGDGPAPAGQPGRGLQDGDRGARGLCCDVCALQQDAVDRAHARAVSAVDRAQQTGTGQVLQQRTTVGVVAHRACENGG